MSKENIQYDENERIFSIGNMSSKQVASQLAKEWRSVSNLSAGQAKRLALDIEMAMEAAVKQGDRIFSVANKKKGSINGI